MIAAARSLPTIRPARTEDAEGAARTILAAQRGPVPRGWFDIALNWPEPQCLGFVERIARADAILRHTSQFIIAEVDGNPPRHSVPCLYGTASPRDRLSRKSRAMGWSASELSEIFRRGACTANCWVQGGVGDWLIEHVAVQSSLSPRRACAGVDRPRARGRQGGHFERVLISFLIGNEAAERCCYAKAGFVFAEEKRDPQLEALTGAPGSCRFERAI